MSPMAGLIAGFTNVYLAVCLDPDQRKHQHFASLELWGEFTGGQWIPRSQG